MTERKWTQRMEVAGEELVDQVKALFDDANAKRVVIRDQQDRELLAVPLTLGVAGGAITVLAAPILAAVAAIGGVVAKVRLDMERVGNPTIPGQTVDPNQPTDGNNTSM